MNKEINRQAQAGSDLDHQNLEHTQAVNEEYPKQPIWQPTGLEAERLYATTFDLGNAITAHSILTAKDQAKDYDKLLEIIPINGNEAYVRYAENKASQKMVFSDPYLYLNPTVIDSQNQYNPREHSHVSTLEPGRLVREGDKWQLVEKINVRFDALSQEQLQAQAPIVDQPLVTHVQPVPEPKVAELLPVTETNALTRDQPTPDATSVVEIAPTEEPVRITPAAVPESITLTLLSEEQAKQEGIKEGFYELLLPEEYQELRQYLRNDGFLSNDEINASLRDGRLVKEELAEKLVVLNLSDGSSALQEKMTDYLWELHEIIQDPVLEKVRADQLYQVQTIQPVPGTGRKPGESTTDEEEKQRLDKKSDKTLEIVNGGMLANFLHNYKKAHNLGEAPPLVMEKKTRYQWQDVEKSLDKMGLTRELLAESGNLERLLKGEKTGLIDFKSEYNGQQTPLRGKIYLAKQGEEIKPFFQTQKQTLQVPEQYLGYTFNQDDKDILKQKGELGKRVELTDTYTKKKFDAYVGVDKETNSLSVWRADRVFIPMQIKGVDVSKEQQETLRQGGAVRLTGLTSENGQKFDADVQVSAGKRSMSFSPPSEAIKQSIDVKTAKDLNRSPDQLKGTSVGVSTTQDKQPGQKQKKSEAKQKGLDPDVALQPEAGGNKSPIKEQPKNKKAQKDQGLSM